MSTEKPASGVEATSPAPAIVTDPTADIRAKAAAELERVDAIQKLATGHADIAAKAIREGWDVTKTELEVLRASRPTAPMANTGRGTEGVSTPDMLTAACLLAGGMDPTKAGGFDAKTTELAAKRYGKSIGIQRVLVEAAAANGYTGSPYLNNNSTIRDVLKAAFSTHEISDILSNTANKSLLEGFLGVEQSWNRVASIRNKRDFKTATRYRLTGAMQYEEVGPDGELKHGVLGDETYTDSLKTYGLMTSITRTDIINDDLGALTDVPRRLGRGGALKLNTVFWTKFLADTSVFNTDNSKGNYLANASSALSSAGLKLALTQFMRKTDPDGKPLALRPAILLVPPDLEITAFELMNATQITGSSTAGQPNVNPWSGRYQIVSSVYLTATKVWYLLTSPSDLDLIAVSFLNGQQQPTVETADADFNTLGIQMRGYHDFGVDWVDYRAGLKVKGEA